MIRRLLFLLFLINSLPIYGQQILYIDEGKTLGIHHTSGITFFGTGVSFCDFNGDGWDDISLGSQGGDSISLYINQAGQGFSHVQPTPVDYTFESKQLLWIDFDNDGDKDLFIVGYNGPPKLYENDGFLNFTDISADAEIPTDTLPTFAACWGDYNKDGWLDFYLITRFDNEPYRNYLMKNNGNGTFADVTIAAGVTDSMKVPIAVAFMDYNNDGWEDIYIAQDKSEGNTLFENDKSGGFIDVSAAAGADLAMDGMCVAIGDYNEDGYEDIYISNTTLGNKMLKNNGNETFTEVANAIGVGFLKIGWGSNFLDGDNDGDLDLYASGVFPAFSPYPRSSSYFVNNGDGTFFEWGPGFNADTTESYANAIGDLNQDGYPDIAVSNSAPDSFSLWKNQGGTNNWLRITLKGTESNRDAIGSKLMAKIGNRTLMRRKHCGIGYLAQNSETDIFGLGKNKQVDELEITWPNGTKMSMKQLCANQSVELIEGMAVPIPPKIHSQDSIWLCKNPVVNLSAGNFSQYLWSTGDTLNTLSVTDPGTYSVKVYTDEGICLQSADVVVMDDSLLLSTSATESQHNQANGTTTVTVMGGKPPYVYKWNDPAQQTTPVATGLAAGTYKVQVRDVHYCQDSAQVDVPLILGLSDSWEALNAQVFHHNEILYIKWESAKKQEVQVSVLDVQGRVILADSHSLNMGQNEFQFPVSQLSKGVYTVMFSNPEERTILYKKFIK